MPTAIRTGADLAKLMGVDPGTKYAKFPTCIGGHSFIHPTNLLSREFTFQKFNIDVKRVTEGEYKSGEIWRCSGYDIIYMYIGKTPDGLDLVATIGGDTERAGEFEKCKVNSGRKPNVYFDKQLVA